MPRNTVMASPKHSSTVLPQWARPSFTQGLHLSVGQIRAKLQAGGRGASLKALAAQQGISEHQLWAILLDAEQKGHDVLVRLGYLTQDESKQGMHLIQSWDLTTLDQHIRNYFLND